MDYFRLRGTGVSPGIATGEVRLTEKVVFSAREETIRADQVTQELGRLQTALERTRKQLVLIKEKVGKQLGEEHSFIFESHVMILEDKSLIQGLRTRIKEDLSRTEWAITQLHRHYMSVFDSISDDYLKERKYDVTDVLSKVYLNLQLTETPKKEDGKNRILVAHDLLPSEAASRLSRGNVLAVALDVGGTTSHTAILARSLNIPTVMGLRNITHNVKDGDTLIVDGIDGEVIVNPPLAIRREFIGKKKKYDDYRQELQKTATLEARTLDGVRFVPLANIELPEEVEVAQSMGAEGIAFDENIPLGAMIEVPAAAAITDKIVREVDYLSIGTNDLIQYYLAVDRSNELVSYLFKPMHPSVLRLLKFIIDSARKASKEVTVCGEMAADPLSAIVLLGLGLKSFSMNPIFIPRIKRVLRSIDHATARKIVHRALTLGTAQEIEEHILESVLVKHPTALLMGSEYPSA